jgi:hypothetical protein
MKRRSFFGFLPLPLLGFWRRRAGPIDERPVVAKARPTMADLFALGNYGPDSASAHYYKRLLGEALRCTGNPTIEAERFTVVISNQIPAPGYARGYLPNPSTVPEPILRHFRHADRDESFPRGIPYEPLR